MSDGWSAEIEAAWVAEAKRRAEEIDRGELELVDSAEMMARLRERAAIKRERSARLGADPSVPHAELSPETALEHEDTGDELDNHERAALDAAISRSLVSACLDSQHTRTGTEEQRILMPVTDEAMQILEAALALPEAERARLASVLQDSVTHGATQEEIDAAILEEVERRRDDLRSGRTKGVPWEEVQRELDAMIALGRRRASTG